jgi:glutaredoxin 3
MAEVEIYASMFCGFCYRAKHLLDQKGVAYTEIDVTMNPIRRREMAKRASGRTSVPQIFVDGRHLGGCRELYELDATGRLDPLLAGAAGTE